MVLRKKNLMFGVFSFLSSFFVFNLDGFILNTETAVCKVKKLWVMSNSFTQVARCL